MKVIIAGDYSPKYRIETYLDRKDYSNIFGGVKDVIKDSDIAIVNFESVIRSDLQKPITKSGSCLSCHENAMDALKWTGFNIVTLANNHTLDFGAAGLELTLQAARKSDIDVVGAGRNISEARKILYKRVKDITIAIINCCEHEFSIAEDTKHGANPLDVISQYCDIQEAKKKSDYIIVIVHGGHEHYQLPSIRMQETYRFFIDAGADVVVNHHQHCYSGYEVYKNKPIFYGVGNFCFDEKKHINPMLWIYGFLVELDIQDKVDFRIIPFRQCDDEPKVTILDDTREFDDKIQQLNSIIIDKDKLSRSLDDYYSSYSKNILSPLEPFRSRVAKSLFFRGLLPSMIGPRRALSIFNYINCESHLDKLRYALKKRSYEYINN